MSAELLVLGIAACVLGQGFFSGSEIALVSADRLKLRADADAGSRRARLALTMLERPAWTLGTCLLGTNLCLFGGATLAAHLVAESLGLPTVVATLFLIPFTLTFGEMLPKALYQHHADRLVPFIIVPLRAISFLLAPLFFVIDRVVRLFGGSFVEEDRAITRQELKLLLDSADAANSSELTPDDRALIKRVFAFTEAVVEDAMVPLIEVVAVPHNASVAEAARRMTESGHSRLPVYKERIDRITGIILHQDLLAAEDWTAPCHQVARPAFFVPETKRVDELMLEMRRNRQRMAVAVDEYGGAVGLITAEDLLEEIVGEIDDEGDDPSGALVRKSGEREWTASGRAETEHLEQATGLILPEGQYETIAGFLLSRLGKVVPVGEGVTQGAYKITVSKANERAILEVKILRAR
jgi:putative hemolysin